MSPKVVRLAKTSEVSKTSEVCCRLIRRVCAGSLLLGVIALAEPCAAQYRRPSTPQNNAAHNASKSNVDSAKKLLDDANKRLADIRPKHQQAEAEFKKEQREYQQARDAAKRQFEEAPELVRASEWTRNDRGHSLARRACICAAFNPASNHERTAIAGRQPLVRLLRFRNLLQLSQVL
jgi:hypothetical protein